MVLYRDDDVKLNIPGTLSILVSSKPGASGSSNRTEMGTQQGACLEEAQSLQLQDG